MLAARKRNAAVIECWMNGEKVDYDIKEKGGLKGKERRTAEELKEDDVALVWHTSGTTRKPRGVPDPQEIRRRCLVRLIGFQVPLTHKNLMDSIGKHS